MSTFTREDYELAAKAAGLDIWTGGSHFEECGGYPIGLDSEGGYQAIWNPPEDDGDAFRLACSLGMFVRCGEMAGVESPVTFQEFGVNGVEATRHAIFRAAIAIGRAMP
jgi:hypothetical protein